MQSHAKATEKSTMMASCLLRAPRQLKGSQLPALNESLQNIQKRFFRIQSRLLNADRSDENGISHEHHPSTVAQAAAAAAKEPRRRLDVAIVGLPNAGKSQLLNAMVGSNIAAVSRKRHTTRTDGILGAKTVDDTTQLVFVDTPGFLKVHQAKREGLDRDLMATASATMQYVDYSLLVVDAARRMTDDVQESMVGLMLAALESRGRVEVPDDEVQEEADNDKAIELALPQGSGAVRQKFAVVLNKVDLVHPKSDLLDMAFDIGAMAEECIQVHLARQQKQNSNEASETDGGPSLVDPDVLGDILPTFFYVSALKDDGVNDIIDFLVAKATPCQSWEIESNQVSSASPEERVEEIVREKLFRCLHKEVPHSIRQKNMVFRVGIDSATGKQGLLVHQYLLVQTKSHLELVHGSGDRTLERIRESAARDLEKIFGCKVTLQLHVKLVKSKQRQWSI